MSGVGRLGEDAIIARLAARLGASAGALVAGIGDDAALLAGGDRRLEVVTSDLLLEDVHFRRAWSPPRLLGRKALAVNLSDLAAMGAAPVAWLLDLGLPADWPLDDFDAFVDGLAEEAAAAGGVPLAGGDTCVCERLVVAITALGRVDPGAAIRRGGARVGDRLAVTGPLGGAAAGLALLERGWRLQGERAVPPDGHDGGAVDAQAAAEALRRHLSPQPELAAGLALAGRVSAGLDLSDGLARDLPRLCAASGCGALVEAGQVPIDPAAESVLTALGLDPLATAVAGGEDYRLLLAMPADADPGAVPLTVIGRVLPAEAGLALSRGGRAEPWPRPLFEHFRDS